MAGLKGVLMVVEKAENLADAMADLKDTRLAARLAVCWVAKSGMSSVGLMAE